MIRMVAKHVVTVSRTRKVARLLFIVIHDKEVAKHVLYSINP
jgi:hypothetical protein